MEAILMWVFHVFADGAAYLFASGHSSEVSEAFLFVGCGVWVFLEAGGDLIEVVFLSEEVRGGSVEVVVREVPEWGRGYLSTAE
jgi:hypothetical protein